MVRSYLCQMRNAGLRPEKILLLVRNNDPRTKKPIGTWLPPRLQLWHARRSQELRENYWPRYLRAVCPQFVDSMVATLSTFCSNAQTLIEEMTASFDYSKYCDNFEQILFRDFHDERLHEVLRTEKRTVLFSGGGLVPQNILGIPNLRLLHVHPGFLPHIRGADGLLWSLLVRQRPGVSAFYMDSKIDQGNVICATEYPRLTFRCPPKKRPNDLMLYRALFSFYDPILRGKFLVENILTQVGDLAKLPTKNQDLSQGTTYHFMNNTLKAEMLSRLFT